MLFDPQDLYFAYAGILIAALFFFFVLGRSSTKGMRLRLRGGGRKKSEMLPGASKPSVVVPPQNEAIPFMREKPAERPVNVVFNYNGHSWDAYEVLGLPAGASLERVEDAFKQGCAVVDKESQDFIEAAYRAILAQWHKYHKASGQN